MPRPTGETTVPWRVHVPADLAAQIEQRFWDPIHQKPQYGVRNQLVVTLMKSWLIAEQDKDKAMKEAMDARA